MKIHHLTVKEAFASVQSGPEGLNAAEAARRLREYGPNEVQPVEREPWPRRLFKSFTHFFAIILWLGAALAFFAEAREPGQGMLALGLAIVGVIFINGAFSFWQEYRAERALDALRRVLPQQVKLRRDGNSGHAPASALVPGDVLFLEAGDKVPADCRVVEAFALRVNNATVTGESVPHSRDANASDEQDFLHSHNVLLAGTTLVAGEATALVFATGAHTAFGQIAHLTQAQREPLSPLQKEVVRLSRLVGLLALGLGVAFFFVGRAMGLPFWSTFIFAIGIIVANVPEGLLPTLTLALAMGSQRMAKRNALVRHLPAVETLGAATVICTDKTGTLTENRITAKRVWLGGQSINVSDQAGLRSAFRAHPHFFEIARHSQNLKPAIREGRRQWLGDPLEIALVELADQIAPDGAESPRLDEIPFDSRRRRMSTLHQERDGRVLFTKGALEAVLPLCGRLELNDGPVQLDNRWREKIIACQDGMAQEGWRVLALAWRQMPEQADRSQWETELTLAGLIALEDPPRAEAAAALLRCRAAGIRVIMVTGDHPRTALAIAKEIGLVQSANPVVITGDQLHRFSNIQLQLALDASEILFARVSADQKMRIVAALKRKGENVAVTGDGVNDAPALKKADIGISMGLGGTDVAREAADIILLDDNFATIVAAIEEGRAVYANIRKFLTYILTSNIPELVPYLAFVLFKIPLPLTVIQILAVDLGTDMMPALALGAEPPNPTTMRQPPRRRTERLLNFALIARAYLWLGLLQAGAAMAAFFFMLHRGGWHYGAPLATDAPLYREATTACLSAIIVMQVVNVFICRSRRESAFKFGLFSNPLVLVGIMVELTLILLVDYTPWGNAVFGTAPIPFVAWVFILPFAVALLALEELRKWMMRRNAGTATRLVAGGTAVATPGAT
ncbi:MAG TPA: cation-transporting P-type ATPase [Verrucomicrobiae bacterium]|nr:cation-transporting P-type ATPase [Verrucomicrobiae bacterium]